MFCYELLDKTKNEILHQTFLDAFSDYQVKLDLSLSSFNKMLQRRGYASEMSIGTFKNERLVGFILNGYRSWNEKSTVYDLGTGVIGEYRRQGLTSNMLLNIKKELIDRQVEQYLLEVIKTNSAAIELYKKQGFQVQREFSCFRLDRSKENSLSQHSHFAKDNSFIEANTFTKTNPITTNIVVHVEKLDLNVLTDFWDMNPSWQNSVDSISAISEAFLYSVVYSDNSIVGYGVIDKETGDIPQIAVKKEFRGKGVGRSLMADMIKNTKSKIISVINVEVQSDNMKKFLVSLGFENYIDQYEMIMPLR